MSVLTLGIEVREASTLATVAVRTPDVGLPPAALARHVDLERRRELARALHAPPRPRTRGIAERIDEMRDQLARYRVQAIALHARLLELENAGNDNMAALRRQLIESSVQIEGVGRAIIGPAEPQQPPPPPPQRLARGTEPIDDSDRTEWIDQPTLRRVR
jgi:hypothetical protein